MTSLSKTDTCTGNVMNIGVMGYYGFGNAGDEIILDALRRFLTPHRVIPLQLGFPPTPNAIRRLNAFDFLILGGGGLYNDTAPPRPFSDFHLWMKHLDTPIGVLGLGVKRLAPHFAEITHKLVEAAEFFVVRDRESKQLIGHPGVEVAPDLTFYRPLRVATDTGTTPNEKIICGVNLRWGGSTASEWANAISALPCIKQGIPFSTHPCLDDRKLLLAIDPNCPTQFSETAYASFDLFVGAAFHSIVFAIQNGIPAVAINYHLKVRRLMEEAGLEEYVLEWHEWDNLRSYFDKTVANRKTIREQMLEYTAGAETELKQVLRDIRDRIEVAGRKRATISPDRNREPKVSIIVLCRDANTDDVAKTIHACVNQTHCNLEVIPVAESQQAETIFQAAGPATQIKLTYLHQETTDWVVASLESATGKYVTWLQAGDWYADDAISVLVNTLEEKAEAEAVHPRTQN
jgi:hypothetical protein